MKTHRLARLIATALLCTLACVACSDDDDADGWSPRERADAGDTDAADTGFDAAHCEADTGPPPESCDPGQFKYEDTLCPLGAEYCGEAGDGRCYDLCETDADCTDPCRPYCRRLGLFAEGDNQCNEWRQVCRRTPRGDCSF